MKRPKGAPDACVPAPTASRFGGAGSGGSDASNLRQVVEVPVACVQGEVVLQDECREPHVVRGHRCPLLAELPEDRRVVG